MEIMKSSEQIHCNETYLNEGENKLQKLSDTDFKKNEDILDAETIEKSIQNNNRVNEQNYKFYVEYCKLYEANIALTSHLSGLLKEKGEIKSKIQRIEVNFNLYLGKR